MATYLYDWPTNGHHILASDICIFPTYWLLPSTGTSLSSTQHLFWWTCAGSLAQQLLPCCLHQPVNSTCELHSRGTDTSPMAMPHTLWDTFLGPTGPYPCPFSAWTVFAAYGIQLASWLDLGPCAQRNNQSNCTLTTNVASPAVVTFDLPQQEWAIFFSDQWSTHFTGKATELLGLIWVTCRYLSQTPSREQCNCHSYFDVSLRTYLTIWYLYCFTHSLLMKLTSVLHFLSQNPRCYVEENKILWDHHNASKTAGHTCHVSNNATSQCCQWLCSIRRGRYWLEGKWCCYDEINSVHKLLVHIMKHIHHPTRWKRYTQGSKCQPLLCSKISQCADYRVSCNCPGLLQLSEGNGENHEILSGYPVDGGEIKNGTSWMLRTNVDPYIVPLGEQYCSWLNNTAMREIKIWIRGTCEVEWMRKHTWGFY